jgi:hypothetical protein
MEVFAVTTVTWTELETIEGIINGAIMPEALPFAALSIDEQAAVISQIDDACDDIAAAVVEAYPDLDDPAQRNERLRRYKAEVVRRQDPAVRAMYAEYFDTIMGVCLRNASGPRAFVSDESGCLDPVAA